MDPDSLHGTIYLTATWTSATICGARLQILQTRLVALRRSGGGASKVVNGIRAVTQAQYERARSGHLSTNDKSQTLSLTPVIPHRHKYLHGN